MSGIPTPQELIEMEKREPQIAYRLGTVTVLFPNSTAKVQFYGEDTASEKQYAYLSSYVPKVNDRVLLAPVGGTYVILGKILYNASPTTPTYPSSPSFSSISVSGQGSFGSVSSGSVTTSGQGSFGTLKSSGTCEIDGNLDHDGSNIGFFGTTPTYKRTVYYANTDDIATIRSRLNSLILALGYYGLINPSN